MVAAEVVKRLASNWSFLVEATKALRAGSLEIQRPGYDRRVLPAAPV